MQGLDSNWKHVQARGLERASLEALHRINVVGKGLLRRIKQRNVPNTAWYYTVRNGKEVVAYICGQGTYVSTILANNMVPKGTAL